MPRKIAPRFGIGEWYGHSFVRLTKEQRKEYARIAPVHTKQNAPPCPFLSTQSTTKLCWKKGGVCSARLYELLEDGSAKPADGEDGKLRVMCPSRFEQNRTVYAKIGEFILGTDAPEILTQVRFLRRTNKIIDDDSTSKGSKSEDVGNIDIVLVNTDKPELFWCAVEIQAVYFSGKARKQSYAHIAEYDGPGVPFPDSSRRPDYRSSGPKRFMPQLQIKVPTLRRWGKKMALVVDVPWFGTNVVGVPTVDDISNCDIVWFLVDFDETTDPAMLIVTGTELHTLERAVEGLTGGYPVTLKEFEEKIRAKLPAPLVAEPIEVLTD